jgi:hypothetical protein
MPTTVRRWLRWKRATARYWWADQLHRAHVMFDKPADLVGCNCDRKGRP